MSNTRPAAPILALDIGGVCLELRHDEACRRFGVTCFGDFRERFPEVWRMAYEMETGDLPESEFMTRAAALLGMSEEELYSFWLDLIGGEIPGAGDFVAAAVALGCRPVFLSDVSPLHYRALLPRLSFAEDMHGAVVSYEVGALKPEAAMFAAMENKFCGGGVPVLYLDDREGNVRAAQERGWTAYQFGTFDEALALLRRQMGKED